MVMFWFTILAASILLYVLLDGFDLGVGMLFGTTRNEARRRDMLAAVDRSGTATRPGWYRGAPRRIRPASMTSTGR